METHKIRFIGRHIKKDNQDYFAYSGCGFEFNLKSNADTCSFKLSLFSELREHNSQYIDIFINDNLYSKVKLVSGLNEVEINLSGNKEKYCIRVIKVNEAYLSSISLVDITLKNAIFDEIYKEERELIGFFGDSITCGYGLLDLNGAEFKMESEDFTKTYAYLASKSLNMDYSVVARSGISLALPIYVDKTFIEIYDTVDMFIKCKDDRILDYAVLNIGTNDQSALFQTIEKDNRPKAINKFKEAYLRLINHIINDNPEVKIVIAYNMIYLEDIIKKSIKEVFQYACNIYPNKMAILEFDPDSNGANFHPYMTSHEENAKLLVDIIKMLKKRG